MAVRRTARIAATFGIAGAVGLGLLVVAEGAYAQPQLPPVTPEDLVSSVLAAADPGPFNGTVELENNLGLPALPQAPQAANGTSTARIWSGGDHLGRVALPTDTGERTLVSDGTTHWAWNSDDHTVVKRPADHPDRTAPTDPAAAAAQAIAELRATSTVAVDGTATVAGRGAYELVLTPAPTERTLLREVRVAVDAEKRIPLRLTVLATGSTGPALQVGFTDLTFGPQDPALFTFTPPPGATITEAPARDPAAQRDSTTVGDGWDTVRIMRKPADTTPATSGPTAPGLSTIGTPVSGPWGSGRLITAAVGSAIITDDGRIAAGAVPAQVLTDALSR
jgi:outer membrane lipoprotein-sorting protein